MAISAQFQSNMMLPLLLLDKENDNEMNNMALMLMMAQNGQHGGNGTTYIKLRLVDFINILSFSCRKSDEHDASVNSSFKK